MDHTKKSVAITGRLSKLNKESTQLQNADIEIPSMRSSSQQLRQYNDAPT